MEFYLLPILLTLFLRVQGQEVHKKNVLFIGNSLTYYNGMPDYLKAMLSITSQKIVVEVSAYPGMPLEAHLDYIIESRTTDNINTRKKRSGEQTETEKTILSKKWDVIVLQEATIRVLIPEIRKYSTEEAIKRIKKLVDNENCNLVLFMTWPPIEEFPVQFCYPASRLNRHSKKESYCSIKFNSLEEEFNSLNANYDSVAVATSINKVDIGSKYYEVLRQYPTLKLYDEESHPTKSGAYLNACIFYKFLTNTKFSSISYYGDLSKERAILLQKIVD